MEETCHGTRVGSQCVTTRPKGKIGQQLRTVFNLGTIGDLTDGQLLERFATRGGEVGELAFAALVERHGPMVLRVCRHALVEMHDAEDAFQATFLILVKQARSLWVQDSLGPWLHRVAHRVATRARASAARVREHERRAAAARPDLRREMRDWDEVVEHLHEEIDRLPERYRVPVVLCDLEGLTHEKAARHLGWPVGTLKTRLARARELLRCRLCRGGLGLPEGRSVADNRLAMVLPLGGQGAALPGVLVESTVRAAGPVAAGQPLSASVISSGVAILIEEVLKTMVVTKLKLAAVVVLVGALGAAGAGVLAQQGSRAQVGQGGVKQQPGADPIIFQHGLGPIQSPAVSATPAYIRQSRALILTRLEEEVTEARARLDRTLKRFQAVDHPAVIRAQETLDALAQRLDRIDRVLVDVVETYPTMVDFSGGPGGAPANQPAATGATRDQMIGQSDAAPGTTRANGRGERLNLNRALTDADGYTDVHGERQQQPADSPNNAAGAKRQSQGYRRDSQNDAKQPGGEKQGNQSNPGSNNGGNQELYQRGNPGSSKGQPSSPGSSQQPGAKQQSQQQNKNGGQPGNSQKNSGQPGEKRNGSSSDGEAGVSGMRPAPNRGVHGHGSGMVSADLDNDGDVDLYIVNEGVNTFAGQKNKSDRSEGRAQKNQAKPAQDSQSKGGDANKDNANQSSSKQSQRGEGTKENANQDSKKQSQKGDASEKDGEKRPDSSDTKSRQEQTRAESGREERSNGVKSGQSEGDPGEQ